MMLAALLNKIEAGASWPQSLTRASAAFLAKDPEKHEEVKYFRVLTVLVAISRKWVAYRLGSFREWIDTWADKELYSIDAGSEEAWWTTAVEIEEAMLKGEEVVGGAADLEKAFYKHTKAIAKTIAH